MYSQKSMFFLDLAEFCNESVRISLLLKLLCITALINNNKLCFDPDQLSPFFVWFKISSKFNLVKNHRLTLFSIDIYVYIFIRFVLLCVNLALFWDTGWWDDWLTNTTSLTLRKKENLRKQTLLCKCSICSIDNGIWYIRRWYILKR